mgnify:CR=1 FL=1
MRTYGRFLMAAILVGGLGCGGGDSSDKGLSATGRDPANGGQCSGSSTGQTCTGEEAYMSCIATACGAQIKACYGNNYAKGDFSGGACSELIACQMACPCDATGATCVAACSQQHMMASLCSTCMTTMGACLTAAGCAAPVCGGTTTGNTTSISTGTGTGTGTGSSCAAFQACCASITGPSIATMCSLAQTGGAEQSCALALQGFQQSGYCK